MREKVYFMDFVEKEFTDIETLLSIFRKNTGFQNLSLEQCFNKSMRDNNIGYIFNYLINWANEYRRLLFDSRMDLERIHIDWKRIVHDANSKNIPIVFKDIEIKKLKINFEGE